MWTSRADKQDVTSSTLGSKQRHGGHIRKCIRLCFFNLLLQWKQADVEASDGSEKNKEKE